MTTQNFTLFPGFVTKGIVSDALKEAAVIFNMEALDALQAIPPESLQWAEVGTRASVSNLEEVKIPIRLTSLLGFEPFTGERTYHNVTTSAVLVRPSPWTMNMQWPLPLDQTNNAVLKEAYNLQGLASDIIGQARAMKAAAVAEIVMKGFTSATLGVTAKALTLPQPGYPDGLPLFSDGTITPSHFANPLDPNSARFNNWFYNAGKITDPGVFGKVVTKMLQVPHASKVGMNMGLQVTDVIGGTGMYNAFVQLAAQTLSLQTTTVPGNIGVATTNIYQPQVLAQFSPSGGRAWRFHIAPQLDDHPYLKANPTAQMWIAVSQTIPNGKWCEVVAPTKDFTPRITLLGEGSESASTYRQVRLLADLDFGAAAGLPHFASLWMEGNIAS